MRKADSYGGCVRMRMGILVACTFLPAIAFPENSSVHLPQIIQVDADNLQAALDAAPEHSTIQFNRNRPLTLSEPLVVRRPMTVQGVNAQLPEKLGGTPLLIVESEHVSISDSQFRGNRESVPQELRAPLLVVRAGDFRIERCSFLDSSKDGIKIDGEGVKDRDIEGGVIRDISCCKLGI